MSVRRSLINLGLIAIIALLSFSFGSYSSDLKARDDMAGRDARIDSLRTELERLQATVRGDGHRQAGTAGIDPAGLSDPIGRASLVKEIKQQLQDEMGLLPVQLLRERQKSFVELYAYDNTGRSSYGTAGYLGNGYFITVKHGVQVLGQGDDPNARHIVSVKLMYRGKSIPARVVDTGDADAEVHAGDWAILKVKQKVDLPPLHLNLGFAYDFADPIVRLGNDYSKGIILATGYIGQRTSNGLVTCLTDGHPGVSGGGVLDAKGNLVGIPIGRMQGDFRFSFILPLRQEMFRKVSPESLRHVAVAPTTSMP